MNAKWTDAFLPRKRHTLTMVVKPWSSAGWIKSKTTRTWAKNGSHVNESWLRRHKTSWLAIEIQDFQHFLTSILLRTLGFDTQSSLLRHGLGSLLLSKRTVSYLLSPWHNFRMKGSWRMALLTTWQICLYHVGSWRLGCSLCDLGTLVI